MKFLKIIGWVFVPYFMLIVQWKKIGGMGKVFGGIWAVIALGIGISGIAGGDQMTPPAATQPPTAAPIKTPEAPKESPKEFKMGEAVKVGDAVFTVHGKKTAKNIGGEYGASANGTYIIIDVTVKNEGKKAITTDSSFFRMMQGDTEFEADTLATTYANEAGKGFFFEDINPGLTKRGKIVFDVADTKVDYVLHVQTGIFGTETEKINLK